MPGAVFSLLLLYGFSGLLAFIPAALNCVHMLEQFSKKLALKQSDYYFPSHSYLLLNSVASSAREQQLYQFNY